MRGDRRPVPWQRKAGMPAARQGNSRNRRSGPPAHSIPRSGRQTPAFLAMAVGAFSGIQEPQRSDPSFLRKLMGVKSRGHAACMNTGHFNLSFAGVWRCPLSMHAGIALRHVYQAWLC